MDLFTQCENYLNHCNFTDGGNQKIYDLCMYYIGDFKIYDSEINTLKNYFNI